MDQAEPTSSAQIKKEWLRREKGALAPLGFKYLRRDKYLIQLGDDWSGEIGVHKRAATGPALMVFTDAVSVILNHHPTQRLMRELYERGPKDPGFIILTGGNAGVPSKEMREAIMRMRPTNLAEIDEAVDLAVRLAKEEAIPWLRSQTSMDALAVALSTPEASRGMETMRLEKAATVHYLRGEKAEGAKALQALREFMPSGVPLIDEPREKFYRALQARFDEM